MAGVIKIGLADNKDAVLIISRISSCRESIHE